MAIPARNEEEVMAKQPKGTKAAQEGKCGGNPALPPKVHGSKPPAKVGKK